MNRPIYKIYGLICPFEERIVVMKNWYSRMEVTGILEYEYGPEDELEGLRKRNIRAFDRFMNDPGMVKQDVPLEVLKNFTTRREGEGISF